MAYFPFFIDIKDKRCLVVGGGKVALRKIQKLIEFGAQIIVIAPNVISEISSLDGIEIRYREFLDEDIENAFMVIGATDNSELNTHIFKLCNQSNILVNTVEDEEKCGFIFPALVHKENITVGITTSGKSPFYSKLLREKIEKMLEDKADECVDILGEIRPVIKRSFNTPEQKKKAFEMVISELSENSDINRDDILNLIEEMKKHYED